jgi:hypothetical protein
MSETRAEVSTPGASALPEQLTIYQTIAWLVLRRSEHLTGREVSARRLDLYYAYDIHDDSRKKALLMPSVAAADLLTQEWRAGRLSLEGVVRSTGQRLVFPDRERHFLKIAENGGEFVLLRDDGRDDRWADVTLPRELVLRLAPEMTPELLAAQPSILPSPTPVGFDPVPLIVSVSFDPALDRTSPVAPEAARVPTAESVATVISEPAPVTSQSASATQENPDAKTLQSKPDLPERLQSDGAKLSALKERMLRDGKKAKRVHIM